MSNLTMTDGTRIFVQELGSGRPILLLHGWPANHRIFDYHLMHLAERGYRAIAMDFRGFGFSAKPWNGNNYDTWANDLGEVIAQLDLQDVLLVGYSMGGALAAYYTGTRSDPRVTQLALIAAAAPAAAPTPKAKQVYDGMITALQGDAAQLGNDYFSNLFATPISPAMLLWLVQLGMQSSLWANTYGLMELRDRDLHETLRAITLPTEIYHGVLDNTIPYPLAEQQQQLIPHARLLRFENASHGLIFEVKDQLVQELDRFAASGRITKAA